MSGLPLDEPLYHGERRGVNPASFSPKNGLFSPSSPFLPPPTRGSPLSEYTTKTPPSEHLLREEIV